VQYEVLMNSRPFELSLVKLGLCPFDILAFAYISC
jgi:hypothetical protein